MEAPKQLDRRSALTLASWSVYGLALAAGLVLRLGSIRQSLWLDEFSTLWAVDGTLGAMLHRVPQVMGQSPFYYGFAWVAVHALGESEVALRLPSLIFVALASIVVALAARELRGWKAGAWSGALFWLTYPAVWSSLDARPYGASLFCGAIAVLGFVRSCAGGGTRSRALWIAGACGLVWSHYIFAPFLAGLVLAYALTPRMRGSYQPRQLVLDIVLATGLVSPVIPRLLTLAAQPETQNWVLQGSPLAVLGLLAPFALAAWFPSRAEAPALTRDLRRSMEAAILLQIVTLFGLTWSGFNLLEPRYATVVIVPAAILAGARLAELTAVDTLAPLAVYGIVTSLTFVANRQVTGSMTGAGFQQWREAVAAIRADAASPNPLVLYRSGNAEDDLYRSGEAAWPATLAPLRSPGETSPEWRILMLTYRWGTPWRSGYYEHELAPTLASAPTFYLLCLRSAERGANGHCDNVTAWIRERWPDRFTVTSLGAFRFLTVLRFASRS